MKTSPYQQQAMTPLTGNGREKMNRYERVVMPHQTYLLKYAKTLEKDPSLVEDLVQETLCKALEKLDQLIEVGAVKGWLRTIMYNVCVNTYRPERGLTFVSLDAFDTEDDIPADILEHLIDPEPDENTDYMYECLGKMDALDRCVIVARAELGHSFAHIGWMLGIPPDTAHKRYKRALARLKELCNAHESR